MPTTAYALLWLVAYLKILLDERKWNVDLLSLLVPLARNKIRLRADVPQAHVLQHLAVDVARNGKKLRRCLLKEMYIEKNSLKGLLLEIERLC